MKNAVRPNYDTQDFLDFAAEGDFRHGRMNNPKGDGCGEIDSGKLAFSWQAIQELENLRI